MKSMEYFIQCTIKGFNYFLKMEDAKGGFSLQGLKENATHFVNYKTAIFHFDDLIKYYSKKTYKPDIEIIPV